MSNDRIVWCEACSSEGRILTSNGGPDDTDHGPCPHCEGTGSEVIETQPIEMEDLSLMASCPDCGQSLPLLYPCLQQECPQ
jgi:DnaJ-class molecular chaperone